MKKQADQAVREKAIEHNYYMSLASVPASMFLLEFLP